MLNRLIRARKLPQIMPSHLRLDLHRVEHLAVVDTDDGPDHLGDDDHVAEVGLDDSGLFVGESLLLRLAELLDEAHRATLQTALEPTASTGMDELDSGEKSVRLRDGQPTSTSWKKSQYG